MSCACHWTVGVAASKGKGKLYGEVYSVSPSAIFVPADLPIKKPEDLAGVPISVGYQSGSHYATIQSLEHYMPRDKINLTFADGMLFKRLDNLLEGKMPGVDAVQRPVLLRRAARFPQDLDNTFMIATMINGEPGPGRPAQVLQRADAARNATSTCGPISTRTTTRTNSRSAITP